MDSTVIGFVVAVLAIVRGVVAAVQKETVAWLTIVAVFLTGVALAVGGFKL